MNIITIFISVELNWEIIALKINFKSSVYCDDTFLLNFNEKM